MERLSERIVVRLSTADRAALEADAPPGTPLATHARAILLAHLQQRGLRVAEDAVQANTDTDTSPLAPANLAGWSGLLEE